MRTLASQTGVEAPSLNYPNGRVVNGQTLWSEEIVGDWVQFFQKLLIDSGITENDLPDNVDNGYQLIEALDAYTRIQNAVINILFNSGSLDVNLTNAQRAVFVTGGGAEVLRIILPNPGILNKGNTVFINITLTANSGQVVAIYSGSTSNLLFDDTSGEALRYTFIYYSDGTQWVNVFEPYQGATTYLGMWKSASDSDLIAGSSNKVITSDKYASNTVPGIVEKLTTAEKDSGTADKYVDGALLQDSLSNTKTVYVNIGDWDMNSEENLGVAHGITNYKNIRAVYVMIRNDLDTNYTPLERAGEIFQIGTTSIGLRRDAGGIYDDANYDSTSYNRGFLKIDYIV